jgi:hypothetical protein
MGLLDDYQEDNQSNYSASNDPADSRKKRANLEREIIMKESDLKKLLREKTDFELEHRKLRKASERLRVEQGELDKKLEILKDDERLLNEELSSLRKKLKVLPS